MGLFSTVLKVVFPIQFIANDVVRAVVLEGQSPINAFIGAGKNVAGAVGTLTGLQPHEAHAAAHGVESSRGVLETRYLGTLQNSVFGGGSAADYPSTSGSFIDDLYRSEPRYLTPESVRQIGSNAWQTGFQTGGLSTLGSARTSIARSPITSGISLLSALPWEDFLAGVMAAVLLAPSLCP